METMADRQEYVPSGVASDPYDARHSAKNIWEINRDRYSDTEKRSMSDTGSCDMESTDTHNSKVEAATSALGLKEVDNGNGNIKQRDPATAVAQAEAYHQTSVKSKV
jgi:hypothetical protein